MKRTILATVLGIASLTALVGCGRPFEARTAPGFVELDEQEPEYDYRATTPEGVVMSVRAIDNPDKKGDLEFWTRAVTLQLRDASGYALLDRRDVRAKDGTPGKKLVFGHDENGKPFQYTVALFMAQQRLYVIEAGGPAPQMERYRASLAWMESELEVRCSSIVAPVLASRTCNRW